MRLTILGSATSIGVPVIGCRCPVCTSTDKKNSRTRTSIVFEQNGRALLIDTSTDFRTQALANDLDRVDAVLYTHAHADHISGLDDLRIFNFKQHEIIPIFSNLDTIEQIQRRFDYIFQDTQMGGGKPMINLFVLGGRFCVAGFEVQPIPLLHGEIEVLGFRVRDVAYCTDVSKIPEASFSLLENLDVLIIDALRRSKHPTHFSLEESLAAIDRIKPKRAFLTHLTHEFDHESLDAELPDFISPAYDGQVIDL